MAGQFVERDWPGCCVGVFHLKILQVLRDGVVEGDHALVAELVRIGRLLADELQPRHAPAFLVDRDDRLHLAERARARPATGAGRSLLLPL